MAEATPEKIETDLLETMRLLEQMRVLEQQKQPEASQTPSGPPSTRPEDVPSALEGAPSPGQALGGVLRSLGLQGFEDPTKYPTPRFTHQPTAEERAAFQAQRAGLGEPSLLESTGIAAGRAGLAGAAGVAGAPGDILNVVPGVVALVGGPDFSLPIGSDSIARQFGIKPESMNILERGIQSIGGAVSPGLFTSTAKAAGILPNVAERLYKFVSAGPRGDILMGAGGFAGQETAHALTPESKVAPVVGAVTGSLTVAGAHNLISRGIKHVGKPIIASQDAEEAERIAVQTQRESSTRIETAAEDVTESRELLAAQQRRGKVATDIRQTELTRVRGEAAERIGRAEGELAETFTPLQSELQQGILKERTTAGPPRAIPQIPPGAQETGEAVLKDIAALNVRIPVQAQEQGKQLLESLGPRLERQELLGSARRFFRDEWFKQSRENIGKLFDATENVTGNAPVTPVPRLIERAEAMTTEIQRTGQAAPRGAGVIATRLGFAEQELKDLLDPKISKVPLSAAQREMIEELLIELPSGKKFPETHIPFFLARRLESALSEIAYRGANPVGTITQGKARRLLSALQDDLHDFYVSDIATQKSAEIEAALMRLDAPTAGKYTPAQRANLNSEAATEVARDIAQYKKFPHLGEPPDVLSRFSTPESFVQFTDDEMAALVQYKTVGIAERSTASWLEQNAELLTQPEHLRALATRPVASTIAEALPLAKERYRQFTQTANKTIISKILSPDETVQRQFLKPFTTPRGDHQVLLDVKKVASPEVWDTLSTFALAEGHRIASAAGQFDITAMQKWLIDMRKSGKMDILFNPEQVRNIENYAARLSQDVATHLPAFRGALRHMAPEKVTQFVFEPGEVTRTQNFKTLVPENVFDTSVKVFATEMLADMTDPKLSPLQLFNKYWPLVKRDRVGGGVGHGGGYAPSQLDIMLTGPKYAGVADHIHQIFTDINPRVVSVGAERRAAAQRITEARRQLTETKVGAQKSVEKLTEGVETAKEFQRAVQREEQTLTDFAEEQLRSLKKQANIPEDVKVYAYQRLGPNIHVRAAQNMAPFAAVGGILYGVVTGSPEAIIGGTVGLTGLTAARLFPVWANTPKGRALIRTGLTERYAPSVVGRTLHAIGQVAEEEVTNPEFQDATQ